MGAGRGAGRDGGAAEGAVLENDIDLDRGIAAAIEYFARRNVDDRSHGVPIMRNRERPLYGGDAGLLADSDAVGRGEPPRWCMTAMLRPDLTELIITNGDAAAAILAAAGSAAAFSLARRSS